MHILFEENLFENGLFYGIVISKGSIVYDLLWFQAKNCGGTSNHSRSFSIVAKPLVLFNFVPQLIQLELHFFLQNNHLINYVQTLL